MIFIKSTFSKKPQKNLDLGFVFGGQNGENSKNVELKNMCFFNFDFFSFFWIFRDFGSIWGGPRPSKNWTKSEKIDFFSRSVLKGGSGRVLGWFREGFKRILGVFWEGFGWILGRFGSWVPHRIWRDMCEAFQVEDLALMIRATRGRSIDR